MGEAKEWVQNGIRRLYTPGKDEFWIVESFSTLIAQNICPFPESSSSSSYLKIPGSHLLDLNTNVNSPWESFFSIVFVDVQSLSHVPFFVTPWTAVQSLLKLMSIESLMLSNHLIYLYLKAKTLVYVWWQ